ncbi:MAG: N-acetyl-D-Glu racemase DgcA [Hyphomicrobiaceae bacterium]
MAQVTSVRAEQWPLETIFRISRGEKSQATVVVVEVAGDQHVGRGECTPYARYGETIDTVTEAIRALPERFDRQSLQHALQPGAARNAVDCALWDLAAKQAGVRAWALADVEPPGPTATYYTIALDTAEAMAQKAISSKGCSHLKLKLGAAGDGERMSAVRDARPDATIVVDANEGWARADLPDLLEVAARTDVKVIEQPLPASDDQMLTNLVSPIPICADESAAPGAPLAQLLGKYDAVNIKLDKAGGLTAACDLVREAELLQLDVFLGSMVATSLGIAPALLLAHRAKWIDLDSPLLLARDRPHALAVENGRLSPPTPELWG